MSRRLAGAVRRRARKETPMKLRRLLSCILALLLASSLPLTAFAAEYDLAQGSVTVNATETGQTVTHGTNDAVPDSAPVITQSNNETATTNTVTITATENATANVTIQDVNIVISDPAGSTQNHSGDAAVTIDVANGAEANVTLSGVNIDTRNTGSVSQNQYGDPVYNSGEAAVQITGNGDVTLELDGENTVQSGYMRSGVEKNTIAPTYNDPGSGNGNLTITDEYGTNSSLNATGGNYGSGIGGGSGGSGSNITISGGTVEATGGGSGAGIGGGSGGSGSNITISGGTVEATGGDNGSGIGGGNGGSGSDITISGGTVEATGGGRGAGIGGSWNGSGSNITISGGTVKAIGGNGGAGIGGGGESGSGSNIIITGSGEVTAKGGPSGSGIGGGESGIGSDITVSGDAQVKAQGGNSNATYGTGAAIGGGGNYDSINGQEADVNTNALNEGWIAKYAPGTNNMDTAIPNSLTYKGASNVTGAQPIVKLEPTCTEAGHKAGFMIGNTQVGGETLPATGHSFTNYIPDSEATCTADATKTARCDHDGCDITDTISVPGTKKPHSMGEYRTILEPTCQREGVERRACADCDYYETSTLDKLEHSFTNYISDGKATCTQDGSKTAQCDHGCGLTDTKPDVGSALGHSFTNYISDGNATYEQDGTKTAQCDRCDATHTILDPGSRLLWPEEAPRLDSLYQVLGQDGKILACQTAWKDGVLTITVDADFATLTGSFSGMKTLQEQGIDTIVFETNSASSTFALSDLLAQGSTGDTYQLTHDGETVTFTLGSGTDISKIL